MDRTEKLSIEQKSAIDIFVAKIYDYALIDSFLGFPRFIDSPTSYATLQEGQEFVTELPQYLSPKILDRLCISVVLLV